MSGVNRGNPKVYTEAEGDSFARGARKAWFDYPGGFTIVSNVMWQALADGVLGGESLRVLGYMLSKAKRNNRFEGTQAKIAEALGIKPPNVSRAFRELREAGFIIRVNEPSGCRFWYVDARRAFRGSAKWHAPVLERQSRQRDRDRRVNVVPFAA